MGEDNLVTLHVQLQRGNMLLCYAVTARAAAAVEPKIRAAHRAECVALFSGAVAALERRRMAGTLLEGKCAAAEEAWYRSELPHQTNAQMTTVEAASWAALVGYNMFMFTAVNALDVLLHAGQFAPECSYEQLYAFAQHVVLAAELMQKPRRHDNVGMLFEVIFMSGFIKTVAGAGANCLDARLAQLLSGVCQRLLRSGVVRARRLQQGIGFIAPGQQNFQAAVQKSMNAPGLRTSALPGCGAREAHPAHFKSCAACRTVAYCCREHQVAGWPGHKKACKAARKAAAAAEDEGGASRGATG